MIALLPANQLARITRLALIAFAALVLAACGGESATTEAASSTAPAPTPVPTTAPLSLPPADASLPALAPLPAESALTEATAATPVTQAAVATPAPAATTSDQDASGSEAAGQAASPVEDATVATTPVEREPVDAAPEPTEILAVASADRWSDCVLLAADSTQARAVLDPISAGTSTDMNSVQLNSLGAASVGCDMVSTGLAATDISDYLPTAATCMNAWLESSGGGSVFVGLASVGWGQSVPSWAQAHFVDALDSCFTGASFAADVMSVVSTDSSLTGAFDASCLASSFDSSGTMRAFAQSLAANPTTAAIPVSLSDSWVLSCANVGQMVAVAAAADGVTLSGSTISCIDSELKGTGVVASLVAGTADTDAVGIATIACLTDAEAAALLG